MLSTVLTHLSYIESTQHPQEETNSTSPLSLEGLSFIRDQLNNCTSNPAHDCKLPMIVDKARWPARLLQVRDQSVVLVDFDTNVMPGEFAALSYSWGSASELKLNPPYKATSSTVQALYAGIDVSQLPMTIQHALWLTKELKIQYIWIDSLCIIQDSKQDWEVEAAKMQTVYAMSKVTIIAASSTSCHSGFLRVKRESHQLRNPFPSPFRFMIRPGCESGLHKLASSWEDSHDPLETRGWTFQEEMLSSRYIKFTKDDIQWRCSAGFTCLCGGRPDEECIGLWRAIENPSLETMAWETLVREFSHRRFTKDTDKLVSLSSLARKIAPVFSVPTGQTPYIAGLWRIALVIQLNWSVELTIGEHIDSYVAPSFSWASIRFSRYGIRFRGSPQHVLCRVLDADTTKVYEGNEFGAVSAGFARLYGPFIGCTMRFQEGNAELLIPQEMTLEVGSSMRLDCQLCEHILDDGSKTLQRATSQKQQESGEFSVGILILGQSPAWKGHEANCLILGYMGNDKYQRLGLVEPIYERRSGFPPMYFERLMKEVILI